MICLDTSPVIWAVQHPPPDGSDMFVLRTNEYLRRAGDSRTPLAIPSPALFEYLDGVDLDCRDPSLRVIERNFLVPPFDAKAAVIAGELYASRDRSRVATAAGGRQKAKFDVTILATAIACGAAEVFTGDPHMVDLAGGRIKVVLVTDIPLPPPELPFPPAG